MEDTLHEYLGKLIIVEAREGSKGHPTYIGRLKSYDSDFICLNPFSYGDTLSFDFNKGIIEKLAPHKVGTTHNQKLIGRRSIDSVIEAFPKKEIEEIEERRSKSK